MQHCGRISNVANNSVDILAVGNFNWLILYSYYLDAMWIGVGFHH